MKKLQRLMTICLAAISIGMCAQEPATPQSGIGLKGHVENQDGRFVPNATVNVVSRGTKIAHIKTDGTGYFSFPGRDGNYDLVVTASGYETLHAYSVAFSASEPATLLRIASEASTPLQSAYPWNYGVLVQGGNGLTEDRDGFHFLMAGVHIGKVITPEFGSGLLKANFEQALEIFPFWQSYTPKFQRTNCFATLTPGTTQAGPGLYCSPPFTVGGTFSGVSITPGVMRLNFTHGKQFLPWIQGGGGSLWTNHKYPAFGSTTPSLANNGPNADTSVWNFTPQFGVGFHYFLKPQQSIDFGANAVHISSSSLGDKNPGINASVQFSLGYSWWKKSADRW